MIAGASRATRPSLASSVAAVRSPTSPNWPRSIRRAGGEPWACRAGRPSKPHHGVEYVGQAAGSRKEAGRPWQRIPGWDHRPPQPVLLGTAALIRPRPFKQKAPAEFSPIPRPPNRRGDKAGSSPGNAPFFPTCIINNDARWHPEGGGNVGFLDGCGRRGGCPRGRYLSGGGQFPARRLPATVGTIKPISEAWRSADAGWSTAGVAPPKRQYRIGN